MTNFLVNANSIHIPLADQSVQCAIMSPPYWNLRDYGTAKWEGGDIACSHSPADTPQLRGIASSTLGGGKETTGHQREGYAICPRCGAIRIDQQIGLERTPQEYVAHIVTVMRECKRVLRDDGTLWLNMGDSYAGSGAVAGGDWKQSNTGGGGTWRGGSESTNRRHYPPDGLKPKDLVGIPWRVAFALQEDGWYLRSDIIWSKPNPMPESVTDRPTKAHEYIFLLTKQPRYYYDAEAIKEKSENPDTSVRPFGAMGGTSKGVNQDRRDYMYQGDNGIRNKRSVWEIATSPYSGAHYATFPPDLVRPMVLAGTSPRACETCGAPWERVINHELGDTEAHNRPKKTSGMDSHGSTLSLSGNGKKEWSERGSRVKTIGWRPTCRCTANTGAARCRILDPFCGSGTVLQVAREAGRDAIGLDLSMTYLTDNAMPRALNTNTNSSMATLPLFAMREDD